MSRMLFKKEGKAKFISHLDLMRTMQRTFVRASVAIKHTEGFNPHPYISFALPLSVGVESDCELMDFVLLDKEPKEDIVEKLNQALPNGIKVLDIYEENKKFKEISWSKTEGVLLYIDGGADKMAKELSDLFASDVLEVEKKTKRKMTRMDIIPYIKDVSVDMLSETQVKLTAVLAAQNPSMSPSWLTCAVEQNCSGLFDFAAFKRIEVYDKDMRIFR